VERLNASLGNFGEPGVVKVVGAVFDLDSGRVKWIS
jgi:hypothetical protein